MNGELVVESQIPPEAKRRFQEQLAAWKIPAEIADELLSHHLLLSYPRGSILFLQGAPAEVTFWICSGLVKVYSPRQDGTRIMVRLAGPGDLIGHVDFTDEKGRQAQVFEAHAMTNCRAALFTHEQMLKLVRLMDREMLIDTLQRLNTSWSATAYWYASFLGMSYRERLETILSDLGYRFGVRERRGVMVMPELSHSELAELIGSSRPMVSRLIGELVDLRMIARHGKQYILLNGGGLETPRFHPLGDTSRPDASPVSRGDDTGSNGGGFTRRSA